MRSAACCRRFKGMPVASMEMPDSKSTRPREAQPVWLSVRSPVVLQPAVMDMRLPMTASMAKALERNKCRDTSDRSVSVAAEINKLTLLMMGGTSRMTLKH